MFENEYIIKQLLPNGRRVGGEWVSLNPIRSDRRVGSFKFNISSGLWADFATGDKGKGLLSLYIYLHSCSYREAMSALAELRNGE